MVAEELYKLLNKEKEGKITKDTYVTKKEAAEILKVPLSHFDHYGYKYPRAKVGNAYKYSKAGLDKVIIGG